MWGVGALVMVGIAPAALGIGFLLGAVSLSLQDNLVLANVAEYVLPLLSGVVAPIVVLGEPLARAARVIPLSSLIEAGRVGIAEGMSDRFFAEYTLALVAGVLWLALAIVVWGRFERRARRYGAPDSSGL